MKRNSYTPQFKQEAVRLAEERGNKSAVARELGIHRNMIDRWKEELETAADQAFPGNGNAADSELDQLQRRFREVVEENAILKKAVGIFSNRPQ